MPGRWVPDPAQPIVATGNDEAPIIVEVDGCDGLGVSREDAQALPRLDLPDTDGLVEGARGDHVGLGVIGAAEDVVAVAGEGLDGSCGGEVPDPDGEIVGCRAEVAAVGGKGEVGDALLVAGELGEEREVGRRPHAEGLVAGCGGEEGAVGGELDGGDGAVVAR